MSAISKISLVSLFAIGITIAAIGETPIALCNPADIGIRLSNIRFQVDEWDVLYGFWFNDQGSMFVSENVDGYSDGCYRKFSTNFGSSILISKKSYLYNIPKIGLNCIIYASPKQYGIWRQRGDGMYYAIGYTQTEQEWYMYAIRDTVIYKKKQSDGKGRSFITYVGYVLNAGDVFTRYEGDEFKKFASKELPEVSFVEDKLLYNGVVLSGGSSIVDDDMNEYCGKTVYGSGNPICVVKSRLDDRSQSGFPYANWSFDQEGNLWYMVFKSKDDQQPQLLYAGRDWGYRQPPKKAVCTSDNLRIRLRATTDGYVMGKLMNGQAITILKTGENATIDGKTAPWYRIKTADGLIGWAWGGYIKVIDK